MGDKQKLSAAESERLIALGFVEGAPVYSIANPGFSLVDVKEALFQGTYLEPRPISLLGSEHGIRLGVVPELIQATFCVTDGYKGRGDLADWYVRGHLPQSGFNPDHPLCVVHMELILARIDDPDQIEHVNYQLVADRPPEATSRRLVRASGEPLL